MKSAAPVAEAYVTTKIMPIVVIAKMVMTLVDKATKAIAAMVKVVEKMNKVNKIARTKTVIVDALTMIIHV